MNNPDISNYHLFIFDADGTLRRCTVPGQPCPNKAGEWEIIPGVIEKLQSLSSNPACFIASNQAGIALGYLEYAIAYMLLEKLSKALNEQTNLRPWGIHMCPHHPEATIERWKVDCVCRKPRPGLLYQIMLNWEIGPGDTLFVGDMESDRQAALAAGCDFAWAKDFFG